MAYVKEADTKPTALEANLTIVNADLMVLLGYYRRDLDQLRAMTSDPQERLCVLLIVSEQIYKLAKQIDSFSKTLVQLGKLNWSDGGIADDGRVS